MPMRARAGSESESCKQLSVLQGREAVVGRGRGGGQGEEEGSALQLQHPVEQEQLISCITGHTYE